MDNLLCSVIVANWNGRQYLQRCLTAISLQTYKNIEVILIDNSSTDDSVDFITRSFPDVRLIRNNKNHGFAKANNIGIEISKGKYIATINNDTEADPGWIENLVGAIERSPDIGMCASKILLFNHRNLIDSAGMLIYPDGLAICRGHLEEDAYNYNREEEAFLPTACAALYRKSAVVDAGFFDDDYFAYGEDVDLGLRISMLGYRCMYVPTARVYHYYSGTIGENLSLKIYLSERNRLWTIVKNFSFVDLLFSFYYTFIKYILYLYAWIRNLESTQDFSKRNHTFEIFFILLKVYISAASNIIKMIKRRCQIARKKMKYKKIYKLPKAFKIEVKELTLKRKIYA